jgi:PAS domain S-box-containing protein
MLKAKESTPSIIPNGKAVEAGTEDKLRIDDSGTLLSSFLSVQPIDELDEDSSNPATPSVSDTYLREFSKTINIIVNSITDGFVAIDETMTVRLWNNVAEKLIGVSRSHIAGKKITEEFPVIEESGFIKHFQRALKDRVTVSVEQYVTSLDLWFDFSLYPHERGLFIYFKDITVRKNQELLLAVEKNVLEINAKTAASLKGTVDFLLDEIRKIYIHTYCSVVLFNSKSQKLSYLSGPALLPQFEEKLAKQKCSSQLGPFAAAIQKKTPVFELDCCSTPAVMFAELPTGKCVACWSFPIINVQGEVLGSFSCNHQKQLDPSEKHLNLFARIADFLCIIIENRKAEEKIRQSNDRFALAARATSQAIWDWDLKESKLFLGEGFAKTFGYDPPENTHPFNAWTERIHPGDRDNVISTLRSFIANKDRGLWACEYRFKKDNGTNAIVINRGYLNFDLNGDAVRMIGSVEDVTQKKSLEQQQIKEGIEKQKTIAQAIVDAQESERAKIGKELHDNVNQVLSTAKLFLEVAKTSARDRISLIAKSAEQIHHAINEIRHISQSLIPPSISDIGLSESIKDLVQNIAVTKTLHVDYNNIGDIESSITENQKVMIFRIIQEQVNNVLKHAEASRISIQLKVDNKEIELSVSDNGKGFNPEKIKSKKGVGLSNIASRVDLFNGKFDIITAPGKGCQLLIKILRTQKT